MGHALLQVPDQPRLVLPLSTQRAGQEKVEVSNTGMPLDGHQKVGNLPPSLPIFHINLLVLLNSQETFIGLKGNKPRTSKRKKKLEPF